MTGTPNSAGAGDKLHRRTYLQILGAATGTSALAAVASQPARAATEYRGIQFDKVVNLVDDYGADPTGSEPVDSAIEAAADANTLIKVPDGEYLISSELFLSPDGNLGFLAEDGASPRFRPKDGFNDNLLNIYKLSKVLFEGIDIDIRASDTTGGLRFDIEDRFHVQNVEFLGRGTHPDGEVTNALLLTVTSSSGVGVVRNVVAKKGSAIDHYKAGDGRVGAFVGPGTEGTVRFENCHFEEFGNNGLYIGRNNGATEVIGGTYRNNNISQIRYSGEGSFVEDVLAEVDLSKYTGPAPTSDAYNTRGVVIDNGSVGGTPGCELRNSTINMLDVDNAAAAVDVKAWGEEHPEELIISDTTITVDADIPAIVSSSGPVHTKNTVIQGAASGDQTVLLAGSSEDGSTFETTCIEQTGSDRDGIVANGADCSVTDSNVNVTGAELAEQNGGSISTTSVTFDESCSSTNTSSNSGPTVDSLSVSEVETSDGDAEFDVDWQVSDSDSNLASVDLALVDDPDGPADDTASVNVSGGSASGTTRLVAAGDDGSGNTYNVELVVTDGDGATESATTTVGENEPNSGPSVDSLSVSEVETSDGDAEFDVDWQVSDTDSNLASVDLALVDDPDGSPDDTASASVSGGSASGTSRLVAAGDDGSGNAYTVECVVTDADGATGSATASVAEDEPNSRPTVDNYIVTEAGIPNPHAEITADWSVADADGDLDSVAVEVFDSSGTLVDAAITAVSGSSASGTAQFEIKHVPGGTFDVTLTVTDSQGSTASATQTVTE